MHYPTLLLVAVFQVRLLESSRASSEHVRVTGKVILLTGVNEMMCGKCLTLFGVSAHPLWWVSLFQSASLITKRNPLGSLLLLASLHKHLFCKMLTSSGIKKNLF